MGFIENYHDWLKVADTALPRNIIGYLTQLCLGPLRADPFTLLPYDYPTEIAKSGLEVGTSFLPGELPERVGPRPEISKWMAPHRQTSQLTGDDMHKLLAEAMDDLATKYSSHTMVRTSVLEKSGDAFLVADGVVTPNSVAKSTKREIAHVHAGAGSGDYSLHMSLSPADCKEVISKKWGERMTLSGTLVPHEYLIVYTPRTKEEVEIVKTIVAASIEFMAGVVKVVE
ncbi:hypothetical protein VTL71DRAFT_14541 [Oculimacula yallundae]|uniref:Luciferase domain-containing protein n=1 Tax=Oculimacula yallundae TaxID=86028 RepID=A0ABR4CIS4_9HELO